MAGGLAVTTVAYAIAAVAFLSWTLIASPSTVASLGPTKAAEAIVPGGLTTIGLVWGSLFALTSIVALTRGAGKVTLLVVLVGFVFTWGFLEAWTQAAARPTQGGISPNELWLYFGSRWFFLGAGVLVVAAAAIRWPPRA